MAFDFVVVLQHGQVVEFFSSFNQLSMQLI